MPKTKIEWVEKSHTTVTGCWTVSPGCAHCYARGMSHRLRNNPKYVGVTDDDGRWTGEIKIHEHLITEPLRWQKPTTIFMNSMSDTFHKGVPAWAIARMFVVARLTPQHTYMFLTKRPERMASILINPIFRTMLAGEFLHESFDDYRHRKGYRLSGEWPIPNIWLGVSAEDQERADERIPLLAQTPAAVRFVSCEPLLGLIDLTSYLRLDQPAQYRSHVDWIIVGAESGPKRREMNEDWARSLKNQCVAAGIPFFYKQAFKGDQRVSMPMLDGRVWDQRPAQESFRRAWHEAQTGQTIPLDSLFDDEEE